MPEKSKSTVFEKVFFHAPPPPNVFSGLKHKTTLAPCGWLVGIYYATEKAARAIPRGLCLARTRLTFNIALMWGGHTFTGLYF